MNLKSCTVFSHYLPFSGSPNADSKNQEIQDQYMAILRFSCCWKTLLYRPKKKKKKSQIKIKQTGHIAIMASILNRAMTAMAPRTARDLPLSVVSVRTNDVHKSMVYHPSTTLHKAYMNRKYSKCSLKRNPIVSYGSAAASLQKPSGYFFKVFQQIPVMESGNMM